VSNIKEFHSTLNSDHHLTNTTKSDCFRNQMYEVFSKAINLCEERDLVCVLGAGQCREIPLSFFESEFENVLLTDVDISALKEQITTGSIKALEIEYTGLDDIHFFKEIQNSIFTEDVLSFSVKVTELLKSVETYEFLKNQFHHVDLVYISPIYTQLIYQQVLKDSEYYQKLGVSEQVLKQLKDIVLNKMSEVIHRFNKNAVSLLKENGVLVCASDIFEARYNSPFYHEVMNAYEIGNMDEFYLKYLNQYGMGFGDFGLFDLDQMIDCIDGSWMKWEFDESRVFLIKTKIYKNINSKGGAL
jgi:hypothetical protein